MRQQKLTPIAIAHVFLLMAPIAAKANDNAFKAREVSQVISGADICGIALDDEAVRKFAELDLPEMSELARMTFQPAGGAMEIKLGEMGKSKRVATCGMLRGLAKKYRLSQ